MSDTSSDVTVQPLQCPFTDTSLLSNWNWTRALLDTDTVLTASYDACAAARPASLCAIWASETALVRARVDRLLESLHGAPLAAFNASPAAFRGRRRRRRARVQLVRGLYGLCRAGAVVAERVVLLARSVVRCRWCHAVRRGRAGRARRGSVLQPAQDANTRGASAFAGCSYAVGQGACA